MTAPDLPLGDPGAASGPPADRSPVRAEGPHADGPHTARPLAGRTVLITRAPDRARSLADLLERLGARVVVAPVTTTARPASPEPLDAAVRALDAYAWVAVTSVNAVDALRDAAARTATPLSPGTPLAPGLSGAGRGGPPGAPDTAGTPSAMSGAGRVLPPGAPDNSWGTTQPSMKTSGPRWAAVGPATSRALHAAGVPVSLEATGTAADLATRFPTPPNLSDPRKTPPLRPSDRHEDPDGLSEGHEVQGLRGSDKPGGVGASRGPRVLLPLGDLARSVLADGLRAAGWDVHTVIAYRTVPIALPDDVVVAARGGTIDLGVVAAGSAARELARQLGEAAPPVVAIGQPSAEAAVAVGLTVVGVAERPTDDGLAAALVAAAGGAAPTMGTAPATGTAPTTRSDT